MRSVSKEKPYLKIGEGYFPFRSERHHIFAGEKKPAVFVQKPLNAVIFLWLNSSDLPIGFSAQEHLCSAGDQTWLRCSVAWPLKSETTRGDVDFGLEVSISPCKFFLGGGGVKI